MATPKAQKTPNPGGYTAHNERSRAAFLRDGQAILEKFGLHATTQQIQSVTGVSPSTLYRYFENRETYLSESFESIWFPYIQDCLEISSKFNDDLVACFLPIRMAINMKQTNPQLAAILGHRDFIADWFMEKVGEDWLRHYQSLVSSGVLPSEMAEARVLPFIGAGAQLIKSAVQGMDPDQANAGLGFTLSILGLSKAQIARVMKVPLPTSPA
jgi:AcrR family transcriptional regulator